MQTYFVKNNVACNRPTNGKVYKHKSRNFNVQKTRTSFEFGLKKEVKQVKFYNQYYKTLKTFSALEIEKSEGKIRFSQNYCKGKKFYNNQEIEQHPKKGDNFSQNQKKELQRVKKMLTQMLPSSFSMNSSTGPKSYYHCNTKKAAISFKPKFDYFLNLFNKNCKFCIFYLFKTTNLYLRIKFLFSVLKFIFIYVFYLQFW